MKRGFDIYSFSNISHLCVLFEPDPASSNASAVSTKAPQELSGGSAAPTPPHDSVLEELRQLSRHLAAVRAQLDKHFQGSRWMQEWEMMGKVLDRFLFSLYIILITVTFLTIVAIWIRNNSYRA